MKGKNQKLGGVKRKSSQLLINKSTGKSLKQVPIKLQKNSISIDVSHNMISSLKGIQLYSRLQKLNLNYNNIVQFEQLRYLSKCAKLKQLSIIGNPICTHINYMYIIIQMLNSLNLLNGIKIGQSLQVIQKWQKQNGHQITLFMMQSCVILHSLENNNKHRLNIKIIQELEKRQSQLSRLCTQTHSSQDTILKTNTFLNSITLKSVQSQQFQQSDISQMKDYMLDRIIQIGSQQGSQFVANLLDRIEVCDQEQEQDLTNKPEVVGTILREQIYRQYLFNQNYYLFKNSHHTSNRTISNQKNDDSQLKHFLSVDTALETLETAKIYEFSHVDVYFSMDLEYLKLIAIFIYQQILRLKTALQNYTQNKNKHIQFNNLKTKINEFKNEQQKYKTQIIRSSPKQIYNNHFVLQNILNIMQSCLKRVAFRRILQYKSKFLLKQSFFRLQKALVIPINHSIKQGFAKLANLSKIQEYYYFLINRNKLRRIFKEWKSIKQRKQRLLRKILNRKVKAIKFIQAVTMLKWKMSGRSLKLKKIINRTIMNTDIYQIPNSKKGIQLAYQRVISNRKYIL